MPVVINEFEVVAEQQASSRPKGASSSADEQPSPPKPLDLCAVSRAMSSLERQGLRVWAH
jgi:hypothetical protein